MAVLSERVELTGAETVTSLKPSLPDDFERESQSASDSSFQLPLEVKAIVMVSPVGDRSMSESERERYLSPPIESCTSVPEEQLARIDDRRAKIENMTESLCRI